MFFLVTTSPGCTGEYLRSPQLRQLGDPIVSDDDDNIILPPYVSTPEFPSISISAKRRTPERVVLVAGPHKTASSSVSDTFYMGI